jgi:hypothetical protein
MIHKIVSSSPEIVQSSEVVLEWSAQLWHDGVSLFVRRAGASDWRRVVGVALDCNGSLALNREEICHTHPLYGLPIKTDRINSITNSFLAGERKG